MSTYIKGFRPPDKKWREMKAAWEACEVAGISIPDPVFKFFEGERPDEAGVEVNITRAVKPLHGDSIEGFEVDITKLPEGVTKISFVNSY